MAEMLEEALQAGGCEGSVRMTLIQVHLGKSPVLKDEVAWLTQDIFDEPEWAVACKVAAWE